MKAKNDMNIDVFQQNYVHRLYFKIKQMANNNNGTQTYPIGGMVEWLTHQTSNLWIASRMGSNPVKGQALFP